MHALNAWIKTALHHSIDTESKREFILNKLQLLKRKCLFDIRKTKTKINKVTHYNILKHGLKDI